ncbi:sodium-dependent dopamine transporter-like [Brevipalpus obovatus]|uniref:sodium-dependent dopamine transporter-like n=1 Tax=Brevipalpus obovatus TaxID=246614 RepID=UPI003D9EB97F
MSTVATGNQMNQVPISSAASSMIACGHKNPDTTGQVDSSPVFNFQTKNNQFIDLGYDSLHSTPRQQAQLSEAKEYSVTEMNEDIVEKTDDVKKSSNGMKIIIRATRKLFLNDTSNQNSSNNKDKNSKDPNQISDPHENERGEWDKKIDFLFSIIGFAVDLANVWRFPYLCYRNGGGVFLIPYTLLLLFGALPLFFLELSLGQFAKSGPISVWNKMYPAMKGAGYCAVLISWYVSFYYNVIIGWAFYYIIAILTSGDLLPWQRCDNEWNTKNCFIVSNSVQCFNCTHDKSSSSATSSQEFYERRLLHIRPELNSGFTQLGNVRLEMVGCVAITFTLLYFSLFKGVKTSGKVVWVTATAPYIILTILLIRGLFLEGAGTGIMYYISPNLSKLSETGVWIDAANQVFFSIGVGFGVHLTYASFNKFNNNCYRDALLTAAVNSCTSFYSGFVVFIYLGYIAQQMGVGIDQVARESYGLVFHIYPEALATLPYAKLWSILFFIMLITLGIDSAMGGLEAVITGLIDEFNLKKIRREVVTAMVIFVSFLFSMINCTESGGYTLNWFDQYAAGLSLLCSALFEALAIVYGYGMDRFCQDIETMIGFKPMLFWRICWKYVSPIFLLIIILLQVANTDPIIFMGYTFSNQAHMMGWMMVLSTILPVPLLASWYHIKKRILRHDEQECTVAGDREVMTFPLQSAVYV